MKRSAIKPAVATSTSSISSSRTVALMVLLAIAQPAAAQYIIQFSNQPPATNPSIRQSTNPPAAPRTGVLSANYNAALPTVFLIGDSTVKNGRDTGSDGLWGWGNPIAAFFDKSKINVENQALGGTSTRSYINEGHWGRVLALVRKGDYLLMQFGHNDGGGALDDRRARKSLNGNGDESQEVTLQGSGKTEAVHTYGWYLRKYIADTKAKGATPIVCSLIPRNDWTNGKVRRADNSYGKWAKEAAEASGTFFIDLNNLIADRYDKLGQEVVKPFFPKEHTHTGWDGAKLNAECVVAGIRALTNCPLSQYLTPQP